MILPHVFVRNPSIAEVLRLYVETFDGLVDFRYIKTPEDEEEFCNMISTLLAQHKDLVTLISRGHQEVRRLYPGLRVDNFLDRFFITRISNRVIAESYLALRGEPRPGYVGIVKQGLSPAHVVQSLIPPLTRLTHEVYGFAPEVHVTGALECTFDYIPEHLVFVIQELLKNALRSTVERHRPKGTMTTAPIPPVSIELQKGDVHIIIKISDQGGGIPKHMQKEVWQYGWTDAWRGDDDDAGDFMWQERMARRKELAGYGFGLALTKLHAQYFGGDVYMQALPGHGTDMYVLLNHLREGSFGASSDDPMSSLSKDENIRLSSMRDP
mmetsp:Transcript_86548/g.232033  ORF Transcript_86548/g.232033 Transcript_86548/m.232033 type:complete len:325 (-) Transcript_86548:132-1106(-)